MCASVIPSWQALRKEGEAGRRKLTTYTRFGTVALALFQSFGVASMLQSSAGIVYAPGPSFVFTTIVGLTAGTLFLMWLGEQITERGIGNGISLLIFAGIVIGLPRGVQQVAERLRSGDTLETLGVFGLLVALIAIIAFIVFVEAAR